MHIAKIDGTVICMQSQRFDKWKSLNNNYSGKIIHCNTMWCEHYIEALIISILWVLSSVDYLLLVPVCRTGLALFWKFETWCSH